jgi:hypothetical protein
MQIIFNTDISTAIEARQKALTVVGVKSRIGASRLGLPDTNCEKNEEAFKRTLIKALFNTDKEHIKLCNND